MCRITMKHPTYKTAICKTGNKMDILKRVGKIGGCDATTTNGNDLQITAAASGRRAGVASSQLCLKCFAVGIVHLIIRADNRIADSQ